MDEQPKGKGGIGDEPTPPSKDNHTTGLTGYSLGPLWKATGIDGPWAIPAHHEALLAELNGIHWLVFLPMGGDRAPRLRIAWRRPDGVVSYQALKDFRNRYCHRLVVTHVSPRGNPYTKPLGQWFIDHPRARREVLES